MNVTYKLNPDQIKKNHRATAMYLRQKSLCSKVIIQTRADKHNWSTTLHGHTVAMPRVVARSL